MATQIYAIPAQGAGYFKLMGQIEAASAALLNIPEGLVNIGGNGLGYVLNEHLDWDPVVNNDGTFSSLALGNDIYIYAVQQSDGRAELVASKNITVPSGYTADNSRRIGGFHYGRVRTIAQRYDAGVSLPVQIVPNSVWDLQHRPKCNPTGMVEVIPGRLWCDIYLASEDGTAWPDTVPLSVYNAVPLTGTEGYARGLEYPRLVRNAGKRMPTYAEMLMAAYGTPQGATGASDRINTGIHTDYGFDCVSCLNVDQPSGNVWQVLDHYFDRCTSNSWNNDLNAGKDAAFSHGQWYGCDFRMAVFGGHWAYAAEAGARCVDLSSAPWGVLSAVGLRAVCDSL